MYLSRTLEAFVKSAAQHWPILLMTGARQVGKTTLLQHLIIQDGVVYPLEFKKTASPGRNDVRHFQVLERLRLPIGPGGLICLVEQSLPLTASVQSIPVAAL